MENCATYCVFCTQACNTLCETSNVPMLLFPSFFQFPFLVIILSSPDRTPTDRTTHRLDMGTPIPPLTPAGTLLLFHIVKRPRPIHE